jgi:hypothetical protein
MSALSLLGSCDQDTKTKIWYKPLQHRSNASGECHGCRLLSGRTLARPRASTPLWSSASHPPLLWKPRRHCRLVTGQLAPGSDKYRKHGGCLKKNAVALVCRDQENEDKPMDFLVWTDLWAAESICYMTSRCFTQPDSPTSIHSATMAKQSQTIRFRDSGCMAHPADAKPVEALVVRLCTEFVRAVGVGDDTVSRFFSRSYRVWSEIFHSAPIWNLKSLLLRRVSSNCVVVFRACHGIQGVRKCGGQKQPTDWKFCHNP